jgi:hypothetical protein
MAFNIADFITRIGGKNGISRRTHFQFEISLPTFLQSNYTTDHLTLLAVSTNLPSVSLDTTQIRRSTVSYNEAFPTNISFGDLSATFFSDGEGKTLTIFKDWLKYIFPTDFVTNSNAFRLPYKSDYATTATIKHFDPEGRTIAIYKFDEVYPASISDIPMNWGAFDDLVTLSADFKYSTYSVESVSTTNQPVQPNQSVIPKPAQNNRQPESPIIKP